MRRLKRPVLVILTAVITAGVTLNAYDRSAG